VKHWTQAALRAAAVPLALALPACTFPASDGQFGLGDPPRTSAVFCDIEADRHCSSADERLIGIDLARANEDGFWAGKSSRVGLDYSPQALAACGGQPQAVLYQDAFPNGTPVCVNPDHPGSLATAHQICKEFCFDQGWIDTQGNAYGCNFIAWHSRGAEAPFAGACTDAGTLRPDFQDPRRVRPSNSVTWTAVVGVSVAGSDLTKIAAAGWGNAGAVSTRQLAAGDGAVLVTASETNTLRIFGLGNGNTNASFEDVEFGLVLTQAGTLLVCEPGNNCARVAGPYQTNDELEVGVVNGKVHYRRNGALLYESAITPSFPLLLDAALNFTGATLKNARTTF
jgi:hypothetical protein